MKGYTTTISCVFGVLGALATSILVLEYPQFFVWEWIWRVLWELLPNDLTKYRLSPVIALGVVGGIAVFLATYITFWKLELWAAGLASRKSAEALKKKKGLTVAEESELLVKKYGRG